MLLMISLNSFRIKFPVFIPIFINAYNNIMILNNFLEFRRKENKWKNNKKVNFKKVFLLLSTRENNCEIF